MPKLEDGAAREPAIKFCQEALGPGRVLYAMDNCQSA